MRFYVIQVQNVFQTSWLRLRLAEAEEARRVEHPTQQSTADHPKSPPGGCITYPDHCVKVADRQCFLIGTYQRHNPDLVNVGCLSDETRA